MNAIVCDSCVMQHFTTAVVRDIDSASRRVVECIAEHHSFAMDFGGKMKHQWLETCGHELFGEYFFQWLREGKIAFVEEEFPEQHKRYLRTKCQFPFSQRHEGTFIAVASKSFPNLLVSDDLDFWEPAEKGCTAQRRLEIMTKGAGSVSRYVKKHLEVDIMTAEQALPILCGGSQNGDDISSP